MCVIIPFVMRCGILCLLYNRHWNSQNKFVAVQHISSFLYYEHNSNRNNDTNSTVDTDTNDEVVSLDNNNWDIDEPQSNISQNSNIFL